MDDDKKNVAHEMEAGLAVVIFLAIIIIAWPNILAFLSSSAGPYIGYIPYWYKFVAILKGIVGFLILVSIPLSVFFFIGIIYSVRRLRQIREKERLLFDLKVEPAFEAVPAGDSGMAHQWEKVTKHIESGSENDWKLAIIEADVLLDDLLSKMGYRGESVGEKLKRVNPGDMKTLRDAWDAHMVRNSIAHKTDFKLGQHDAQHTIHLYRKVFEEFFYI